MGFLADDLAIAFTNPTRFLPVLPSPEGRRKFGAVFRAKMSEAKRYFLEDDITEAATWLGVQHPDVLLAALSRARLPHKKVWIEWPKEPQMRAAGWPMEFDAPERAGVLIERLDDDEPRYTMHTFSKPSNADSPHMVGCALLCINYHLNASISELYPAEEKFLLDTSSVSAPYAKAHLLGSMYSNRVSNANDEEERKHRSKITHELTRHAMFSVAPFFRPVLKDVAASVARDMLRREIKELAGSWRFVIALLCIMNSHDYAQQDETPRAESRFVGGKKVVFNQHIKVRLRLPRKVMEGRLLRDLGESIPRPQHDVDGSWRTNSRWFPGLAGCKHVYVNETPKREVCVMPDCGHKRWWVNDYKRGDPEVGIITRDRIVTR